MAAERGAHHHSFENAKTDDSKPDIFTVVAQEGLKGILQPAFCHVCKVNLQLYLFFRVIPRAFALSLKKFFTLRLECLL